MNSKPILQGGGARVAFVLYFSLRRNASGIVKSSAGA